MSRPLTEAGTLWDRRSERYGRLRARVLAAFALCLLVLPVSSWAAPFRGYFQFTQPDGYQLTVWGQGDEFHAVFETTTGYTVVFDPAQQAYFYAQRADDGKSLLSTGALAHATVPPGLAMHVRMDPDAVAAAALARQRQWDIDTEQSKRWSELKASNLGTPLADGLQLSPPGTTTTGAKVGLTLLIDFSDAPATIAQSSIDAFLNGDSYTGFGNNGSVKEYFSDNSNNRLTYTNVTTIYVRMTQPKSYYNNTSIDCGTQGRLLINDAMTILKARSDYTTVILPTFAGLTVDGSNRALAFNVFFAGGNSGVWSYGLWPHSWSLGSNISLGDGHFLFRYQITNVGASLAQGTFDHENGHMLCGFPDLYDYGYDSTGGAGYFSLMGSGGSGGNPSQVDAYLKLAAGWATATDLTSVSYLTGTLTSAPTAGFDQFYRYRKPGVATEYYLLENRQKIDRDLALPSAGIAVWHVDELGNRDNQSLVPNTTHANYELTLVQADNLWHFQNYVNAGDANDLYRQGNTAAAYTNRIDDSSSPNAHWWDGTLSGMSMSAFSLPAASMTFTIGAGSGGLDAPILAPEPAVTPGTTNTIYWSAVTPLPEPVPPAQDPVTAASTSVETGHRDVVPVPTSVDRETPASSGEQPKQGKPPVGAAADPLNQQPMAGGAIPVQVVLDRASLPVPSPQAGEQKPFFEPPQLAWSTIMNETFEGIWPAAPWAVYGTPTWDDTSYAYHGGFWSAWCADSSGVNPASGYVNNMNAWMVYGPFSLADASSANVVFWYKNLSEQNYDYFQWMASTDGVNFGGWQISGDQNTWRSQTYDLSGVLGQPQVWLAFRFVSDSTVAGYSGAFVDDIVIQKDVTALPDLTPNQPANWNNRLPIGITQLGWADAHSYSGAYLDDQVVYVNWEDFNQGTAAAGSHTVRLEVTGTGGGAWSWNIASTSPGGWAKLTNDLGVGPLSAGSHTFKIWVDYGGTVAESNEGNNYYERTIAVGTSGVFYYAESADNLSFTSPANSGWISGLSTTFSSLTPGTTYYYRVKAKSGIEQSLWSNVEHSQQQSDTVTITAGPSGLPNPVGSALTANLTVTATDTLGHPLTYSWSAGCAWASSNGTFSSTTVRTPTWTAPANDTASTQNCTIAVTVTDGAYAHSASASYGQQVLTSGLRPDLLVSAFTVPTIFTPGGSLLVSYTIANGGAGGAGPSTTGFYLSTNSTWDAGDTLVVLQPAPAIGAGGSYAAAPILTMPLVPAGSYYLIAKADATNIVSETSETNNTHAHSTKALPDLVIYSMVVPSIPTTPTFNVTVTTRNQGGVTAPPSTTRLYLSVNSTWDSLDIQIGAMSVPALGAVANYTATVAVTPVVPVGRYYLIAKADALGVITEVSETNNTRSGVTTIGADLIMSLLTVPTSFTPGLSLTVTNTVKNNSGWAAGFFDVAFYLSTNTVLDAADTLIATRPVPGLPAGLTNTAATVLTMPVVPAGNYYLIAKADAPVSQVPESNETNNTLARLTKALPDLVVSALTTLPSGAGLPLALTETTKNQGGAATTVNTWTAFYLSTNNVWDAADTLLGSRVVPPLAAGATSAWSGSFAVPVGFPTGTFYVIAKADASTLVTEVSETNNNKAASVKIGPDLKFVSFTVPSPVIRGNTYPVSDVVQNVGGGNAGPCLVRFYASADAVLDAGDILLPQAHGVPALGPGALAAGGVALTIPTVIPVGYYYLIAVVDATNVVPELLETNNTLARRVLVQ